MSGTVQTLPHSEEHERAVLAGVLLDGAMVADLTSRLVASDFYDPRHRSIWSAICALSNDGQDIDLVTVRARLREKDCDNDPTYLTELLDDLPDLTYVDKWVATLTERAALRQLIEAAQNVTLSNGKPRQIEALREALDAAPADDRGRRVWSLAELLGDPELVELPEPTVPKLAWSGRATLLASQEKLGKSTLATAAAAAVSQGRPFLSIPTRQGSALWATEEHPGDAARRLRDFGADPEKVTILQWSSHPLVDLRIEAKRLKPTLLVIDTLAAIAEHAAPDSGSASDWAAIMRPLVRIARDTGCALLILHHARRSDGKYRDSSEIGAAVDVIAEMSGPATGRTRRIVCQGRYGRGSFSVRLTGREFELVGEDDESALEAAIVEFVRGNPDCTQRKIRESVPGRANRVIQLLTGLIASGQVVNLGTESSHRYHLAEAVPEDFRKDIPGTTPETGAAPTVPAVPPSGNKESSETAPVPGGQAVPGFHTYGGTGNQSTNQSEPEEFEKGGHE